MKHKEFHFPGKNLTLVRRHAADELLLMADGYAQLLLSGGRNAFRGSCYPNRSSYYTAISRLRKSGLLVTPQGKAATPTLELTDAGIQRIREINHPEHRWACKWDGIWYLLSYDIPESDRSYRNVLRRFLKRLRFGCLHQSLWITPEDRRPEFEDLSRGANLSGFAYMFAAQVVNQTPARLLVEQAWDWDALSERQQSYCQVCADNLEHIDSGTLSKPALASLAREEMQAYLHALDTDPLLPAKLHPASYDGRRVVKLHRTLVKAIARAAS